jgi:hypothetical protein
MLPTLAPRCATIASAAAGEIPCPLSVSAAKMDSFVGDGNSAVTVTLPSPEFYRHPIISRERTASIYIAVGNDKNEDFELHSVTFCSIAQLKNVGAVSFMQFDRKTARFLSSNCIMDRFFSFV